ncbi:HECT-type E3 ubiquitin-protein ligase [Aspergillus lucknowensis]|uniref:HECT-type E3 ubiquitin transferase n=1 Tax=Aspergillus lucknowensis TaxID=176173 RepID=A0ABR4LXD1_9EURO
MPSWAAHKPSAHPSAKPAGIQPETLPIRIPTVEGASPYCSRNIETNPRGTDHPTFSRLSSPPYRRGHARSISQPFAAPFLGTGERRKQSISLGASLDTDDDDDDDDYGGSYLPNPLSTSPRKGPPPVPPKDELTTGKCITCNNTVRWPQHLKVFRCTECLTVNDLEPYHETGYLGDRGKPGKDEKAPPQAIPRKAIPLTIERTKAILDRCLSSYLLQRLEAPKGPPKDVSGTNYAGQNEFSPTKSPEHLALPQRPRMHHVRSASSSDTRGKDDSGGKYNGNLSYPKTPFAPIPPPKDEPDFRSATRKIRPMPQGRPGDSKKREKRPYIFRELEDYIISGFEGCDSLNVSFKTAHPSRDAPAVDHPEQNAEQGSRHTRLGAVVELDPKTLLSGDLIENSSWWMVDEEQIGGPSHAQSRPRHSRIVSSRNPRINWVDLDRWYELIMTAGTSWVEKWSTMEPQTGENRSTGEAWGKADLGVIEKEVVESRMHLHRTLLKATENLLKRPRRPLKKPDDIRFLLILLSNPLIYPPSSTLASLMVPRSEPRPLHPGKAQHWPVTGSKSLTPRNQGASSGHHPGIVKRIVGLLANLPNDCHHYLVSWFARFSVGRFEKIVELVGRFVTYRLCRQHGRRRSEATDEDHYLIPSFSNAATTNPSELHAAISGRNESKQAKGKQDAPMSYSDDWQVRSAGRVMALLFTANNTDIARKLGGNHDQNLISSSRQQGSQRGHMIPISSFYNTKLDYSNIVVADFEAWESRTSKFTFCQYPFFLSIGSKIEILEHDARRQMEVKAREAFFSSILTRKAVSQYFVLRVRRDCLVEDSLQRVGEVLGSSPEEMKKGLRIGFIGEEGVDAGGLRKEWFLLLVREVFDPHHGLFIYDEDSRYCYFNPYCLESSEQFFLVGVVLGLAIYNSIILDISLPPFAFKKLLAAAPQTAGPQPVTTRPTYKCSLDDLAEYRPALARGLRGLLEFEGDVAETFCHNFVADVDRYGELITVPLCPGGEKKPVTNANRQEFVDLYVHYHLDTAVARQFEPLRRGFFSVCGGNALSLFRPEEIELLVRGSDEALDVKSLRAVATYLNWSTPEPESEPVVQWFWKFFERTTPEAQRKLLSFITSSDRIPAMGATSLTIQLMCLGEDSPRFPTAHTCFNRLGLYRYATREKLERLLWEAVVNSEGFGLK